MTITYSQLSRCGRLKPGNQLFQIAATIGIADALDQEVSLPPWDYQPFFSVPSALFDNRSGTEATEHVMYLDERARPYLQDYRLIQEVEPIIKQYFAPSALATATLARQSYDWYRELPAPKTALHVRRGDNVTHPSGYHPLRTVEYYQRSLAELPDTASVVVFSDDVSWCRATLANALDVELHYFEGVARPREYVDRRKYVDAPILDWIDIFLMAEANHHIISNSTYAWWGAYLSKDPSPIYPSNWYGWRVKDYTDASRMFPSSWREVHDATMGGLH